MSSRTGIRLLIIPTIKGDISGALSLRCTKWLRATQAPQVRTEVTPAHVCLLLKDALAWNLLNRKGHAELLFLRFIVSQSGVFGGSGKIKLPSRHSLNAMVSWFVVW